MDWKTLVLEPSDKINWNKILWCVYGDPAFPTMICCKIIDHPTHGPCVWGYSVYRKQPGFRTLGISLKEMTASKGAVFFLSQEHALQCIAKLTTPKKED